MKTNQITMKLAEEAKELILEYREVEHLIAENFTNSIEINEDGTVLTVDDELEGVKDYPITEISSVFKTEMEGYAMISAGFYDAFEEAISSVEYEFEDAYSTERIEAIKELNTMKDRCEEIYERLKKIEKEAVVIAE